MYLKLSAAPVLSDRQATICDRSSAGLIYAFPVSAGAAAVHREMHKGQYEKSRVLSEQLCCEFTRDHTYIISMLIKSNVSEAFRSAGT